MKALIHDGKVVQVEAEAFPVHKSMRWVDCNQDVAAGWDYDGTFSAPAVAEPVIAEPSESDILLKALVLKSQITEQDKNAAKQVLITEKEIEVAEIKARLPYIEE